MSSPGFTTKRCDLQVRDYMQMCPQKTSWYSFSTPLRGRTGSGLRHIKEDEFRQLGWYFGAAFPIHDDILNPGADYGQYG